MNNEGFISTKETRKLLGVTTKTLINWLKLILLNLHPEYVFTVSRIFKTFLVAILILKKRKKLFTVELVLTNKKMTLKDKKIFLDMDS